MLSHDDVIGILEVSDDVTVDTEGVTRMVGFSVAVDGFNHGFYLPFSHTKGNLRVLARHGFGYRGWFWDTMLMAHWVNEERVNYSLNQISQIYGGKPKEMPHQMSAIIDSDGWEAVPVAWMDEYSSNDSYITHQLFRKLEMEWEAEFHPDLWEREQKFIRDVMGPMIDLGIKIDVGFCIKEYMRGLGEMEACVKELGFKPSSSKALENFLINELGLPVIRHTKACEKCYPKDKRRRPIPLKFHSGRPSFDKDAMAEYDILLERTGDKRAQTILRYRGWQKTTSSNYKPYMELVDENHVLHPGYKLHGTKTGRLSCAEPNLQQIPKSGDKDWNGGLKQAFIPRDGYELWTVDYSQLQFRMTVAYAVCESLLAIFADPERDIFTEMAKQMGWVRDDVKTLVYLIIFGGGGKRASVAFGVSLEQGKELVEEFYTLYPEIKKIAKQAEQAARRQGYAALWTGRRRHFPKGSSFYKAFNAVIQGGEAEIIKDAMIYIAEHIQNDECRMVLQIHDEIAFEIATGRETHYLPLIQNAMVEAAYNFCKVKGLQVDFKTSAGKWGEK
jgi:DNA polymerase-1